MSHTEEVTAAKERLKRIKAGESAILVYGFDEDPKYNNGSWTNIGAAIDVASRTEAAQSADKEIIVDAYLSR